MPTREIAKLKAELLGDLNHDLRTPLNGIIGLALALGATPLSSTQRELVEHIRASGHALDRAISELLGAARDQLIVSDTGVRPRILVADDEALNRAATAFMLEALNAEVVEAADGEEAVSLYADSHFDLVLMDIDMPRLDGLGAVRAIRYLEREERRARAPIFMLTGKSGPEAERASAAVGADLHLTKPVSEARLLSVISAAFGGGADDLRQTA